MLKTAVSSVRCLSSGASKITYLQSSCRLLHASVGDPKRDDVPDSDLPSEIQKRWEELFSLPTRKRGLFSACLEDRSPSVRLGLKHKARVMKTKRTPQGSAPTTELQGLCMDEKSVTKRKFKSPLAAQRAVRPAVQSARISEICATDGTDEAIDFVLTAPHDTLNTKTWNTLLFELMKAGRRKRAYEMYTEMKRRGFTPDARTFKTMLRGIETVSVQELTKGTLNLERAHKLYERMELYAEDCKQQNLTEELVTLRFPRACYIRILAKAGDFQKIVDVFYRADDSGPLARDRYLYSALFSKLLDRKEAAEQVGNLNIDEQNASDAKFYWRTLEKDMEHGMVIDSYVITPFLKIMAKGRPADQQFALNVVRDFFGLVPPGVVAPPPRLQLENFSFKAVLELCNKSKKFRLCTYFMKRISDRLRAGAEDVANVSINFRQINEQLIALSNLAAVGSYDESERAVEAVRYLKRSGAVEAQKPGGGRAEDSALYPNTIILALGVCWRCGDWERAAEVFSLTTDLPAEDFLDSGLAAKGDIQYKIHGSKKYPMLTSSLAHLARIAASTEDKSKMRQCLRMMRTCGFYSSYIHSSETHRNFYRIELAKATWKLVDAVTEDWPVKEEVKIWKDMKKECQVVLSKRIPVERPEEEYAGLGSDKYIGKLQQAIDFELSARASS